MKKVKIFITLPALIIAGILVVYSCNKKNAKQSTALTTKKTKTPAKRFTGDLANFPDAISKSSANAMISAYANDNNKLSTNSFLYNPTELLNFMSDCENIQYINFFIGEYTDANNNQKLTLIFSGVDNNGNHIYMKDQNDNDYVLDNTMPCPTCQGVYNSGNNIETPGQSSASYTGNYSQNITVASAQSLISNYINSTGKNTAVASFLYDPVVLSSYINNATGISKLHFFLAQDNAGNLKIVISGIDANGNHIFINDGNGGYYVFDNSYPCPNCNITNDGSSLE